MKKTSLLIFLLCLVLAACNGNKTQKDETPVAGETTKIVDEPETTDNTFSVNTIAFEESKAFPIDELEDFLEMYNFGEEFYSDLPDKVFLRVDIDFPVTNNALLKKNIENFIARLNFENEMVDSDTFIKTIKDYFFNHHNTIMERIISGKVVEETDSYVTYYNTIDEPDVVTDGIFLSFGATFDKASGETVSFDIFSDKDAFAKRLDEKHYGGEFDTYDSMIDSYYDNIYVWIQNGELHIYLISLPFGDERIFIYDEIEDILTEEGKAYFE